MLRASVLRPPCVVHFTFTFTAILCGLFLFLVDLLVLTKVGNR